MRSASDAWIDRLNILKHIGKFQNPRGKNTLEVMGLQSVIDMNYPIIYHPLRKLSYKFMVAEAEFIANGDNRVSSLDRYNKNIAQFSDDGVIFNGNYGEPFNSQLEYVVRSLKDDSQSRQAVITIWQPNPVKSKDIRCTISLQFMVRDNKLHTFVNMRSSDVIWGFPYDVFNFTILTLRVLTRLFEEGINYGLGEMYFTTASAHIYEDFYELMANVLNYEELVDNFTDEYTNKKYIIVPIEAKRDWKYVVSSLNSCKDGVALTPFWQINPNNLL